MKELQEINQDKLEVTAVKPIKKELKMIGSLKPQKGHTCFELNLNTGIITIAKFESVDIYYPVGIEKSSVKKKIIIKEKCIYNTALNFKNAEKHFKKMLLGIR